MRTELTTPPTPQAGVDGPVAPGRHDDGTVDSVLAGALVGALSPVLIARGIAALVTDGHVFDTHRRLGPGGRRITVRSFAGYVPGRRFGYLFSIARGDLRFIGPRPLHPLDSDAADRDPRIIPGLLSPHRLRARTGIDYDSEAHDIDQSLFRTGNLALVARYVVAEILRGDGRATPGDFSILGVEVANTTMDEALDWVVDRARGPRMSLLAFVNPDCLNKAVENADYAAVLARADRVLPDGIGVKIAAGFQGVDVRENINGTDMFPRLCERAAREGLSLFLLGARRGVAEAVASEMADRYPGLRIAGTRDGYFDRYEERAVLDGIEKSGADILLVAFGVPRQEFWLDTHRERLGVGVALGVGGLFDFYSGRIPRAPQWLREMGLEWVWRLAQEPGRMWRRYIVGNPLFLTRTWREAGRRGLRRRASTSRPGLLGYGYYGADEPDDSASAGLP